MRTAFVLAAVILGRAGLFAQSSGNLQVLHTFSAPSVKTGFTNSDGAAPYAGLVLSGNTLYGTASAGGADGFGTVFAINTDGSGFQTLYSFTNGLDGANPKAPLIVAGGVLYGTADYGGASNYGTVFSLSAGGSNFTSLYSFTNGVDGAHPTGGLALSGGALYGTTQGSGSRYGSVFMINTDGSGFGAVHDFTSAYEPTGSLFVNGNTLFGASTGGGANSTGTVFTNNGTSFGPVCSFAYGYPGGINSTGADPFGGLVLSGTELYGAANWSGSNGLGAIFRVSMTGAGLTQVYAFTGGSDYFNPQGPLNLSSNMLYGSTPYTIFGLTTNGSGFTNVFSFPFTATNDSGAYTNATGGDVNGGLVLSGQTFYGTAESGGANGYGTIFAVNPVFSAIPLTIQQSGGSIILTWANSGFALQSTTALNGAFTNVPNAASPYTTAISGAQMFFRLQAN